MISQSAKRLANYSLGEAIPSILMSMKTSVINNRSTTTNPLANYQSLTPMKSKYMDENGRFIKF